jgi:hypothetical protein
MKLSSWMFLLGLGGLGYAVYRLFEAEAKLAGARAQRGPVSPELHRALNEDAGRMNQRTAARGKPVEVEEASGAHSRRIVGRGVIRNPGARAD